MSDQEQHNRDQTAETDLQNDDHSGNNSRGLSQTKKYILFGVLAVVVIGGGIYGWSWLNYLESHQSTRNAQIKGHISPVIPRVSGYVTKVYVTDNEKVKKGQVLATIDEDEFKIKVKQAEAKLEAAKAGTQNAKAQLQTVKVKKEHAKVQLEQAKTEYARQKRLFKDKSTTQQKLDRKKYAWQLAKVRFDEAKQQIQSARVKIQEAKAQVKDAKSSLADAKLNLSYTTLVAPIGGRVSKKDIEAGQYVRDGNQVMAIVNDSHVWVVANFKEGEIARIKIGQPVSIKVDAYADTTYQGTVQSIAGATGSAFALLPPDNASGNFVKVEQRIPVKSLLTVKIRGDQPENI